LEEIFKGRPLAFKIEKPIRHRFEKRTVVLEKLTRLIAIPPVLNGTVTGDGVPLPGVTVVIKRPERARQQI